jgi:RimJ/RimL family protein N-acetyltransferase
MARHGAQLWQSIGDDPRLWSGTPVDPFDDQSAFIAWLHDRIERPEALLYAIVDRGSGGAAGLFFLMHVAPDMGTLEMGLVFGPALSRRTGGTEAFHLLVHHLLGELAYRRLEWRCNALHDASRRAAERFGFTLEGVLRQHRWIKGRNCDTALYALLDRDWPALERRLTAWLSPDNFRADGTQIKALREC